MKKRLPVSQLTLYVFLLLIVSCKKDEATTNLIYQTDFTTDDNTWTKSCAPDYCLKYDQGKYDIDILVANNIAGAFAPCGLLNTTYSLNVDCVLQLGDPTKFGSAGFIYNYIDNTNYKVFLVSNTGYFQIQEKSGSNFNILVDWTASSAIQKGNGVLNKLELQQKTSSIELFVNGTSLGVFSFGQSYNFKVGLTAASGSTTDFATVTAAFDNLVIQKLP
jgi:hypothetical protein